MNLSAEIAGDVLDRVRARRPLVHVITNAVAANLTANILLAIGASPAMAVAPEEVAEFTPRANALAVNIGMLLSTAREALRLAATAAGAAGVPWALDPVGVGATSHRTEAAFELMRLRPSVIRANASEVAVLAGHPDAAPRGVDSIRDSTALIDAARGVAREIDGVVAMTGAVDVVTDGTRLCKIANGAPIMAHVSALGCAATAIAAATLAVEGDRMLAATTAIATMAIAGEIAAEQAQGPGSFVPHLIDALGAMDGSHFVARLRVDA
jgi:hydroxyethylthiazole kinase